MLLERRLTANSPAVRNGVNCTFTGAPFQPGDRAVSCPKCGSMYEADSWRSNNNRCAQFNCSGKGAIITLWQMGGFAALLLSLLLFGLLNAGELLGGGRPTLPPPTMPAAAENPTAVPDPTDRPIDEPSDAPTTRLVPTDRPVNTPLPKPTATRRPAATRTTAPTAVASDWEWQEFGRSVNNRSLRAARFGNGPRTVIFIGGLHAGFAPATVQLADRVIDRFSNDPIIVPDNLTVYVVPSVNVDAPVDPGELPGRLNANGVDLNRNWDCRWERDARFRNEVVPGSGGPAPFSEPEVSALRDLILDTGAEAIIFWEALYRDGLVSPGRCDQRSNVSFDLAGVYGRAAGYGVEDFEIDTGQILNGDGSNWLDSVGIPAVVVLLPDYETVDWADNWAGVLAVLETVAR